MGSFKGMDGVESVDRVVLPEGGPEHQTHDPLSRSQTHNSVEIALISIFVPKNRKEPIRPSERC
jgi:hypothetical protein